MSIKPSKPIAGLSELAADYDIILSDVWGVVHDGRTHTPSAADALTRFRKKGGTVVLLTNAPRPHPGIVQMLDNFGLPRAAYDAIVSSGDVTVDLACQRGLAPLHHMGPPRDLPLFDTIAERLGEKPPLLPIADADYVVCTGLVDEYGDPEPYMPALVAMKERDLPMICANPDIVVHVGDDLLWCAGALAERYAGLGGRVIMAGKPHAPIYDLCLAEAERLTGGAVTRARVLCIGDGVATDVRGANAQDLDVLFVAGGIHGAETIGPDGLDAAAVGCLLAGEGAHAAYAMAALSW